MDKIISVHLFTTLNEERLISILMQANVGIPSFSQLISVYGPWLGLIIFLLLGFLAAQYYWFRQVILSKNEEIKRLVEHEKELDKRLFRLIDNKLPPKR